MRCPNPTEPATISVIFSGSYHNKRRERKRVLTETKSDPWTLYLYAMKSPATKASCPCALGIDTPMVISLGIDRAAREGVFITKSGP
jgi:hypothetical protein